MSPASRVVAAAISSAVKTIAAIPSGVTVFMATAES
jgi:hypothetical protein